MASNPLLWGVANCANHGGGFTYSHRHPQQGSCWPLFRMPGLLQLHDFVAMLKLGYITRLSFIRLPTKATLAEAAWLKLG